MEILRVDLTGAELQVHAPPGSTPAEHGVIGVAVSPKRVDGHDHTVVQLLLDDDVDGFDDDLLDGPLIAELRTPAGDLVTRELFDHDRFRRDLHAERAAGVSDLHGVLVLTNGELPPHYIRLAFLRQPLDETGGCVLVIVCTHRDELLDGIERGFAAGSITDAERRSLLTGIDQRHPLRER